MTHHPEDTTADARATTALRELAELRVRHEEAARHTADLATAAERYANLTRLTEQHQQLTQENGRLDGELDALRPQLAEQIERGERLEGKLATAAEEGARATGRADSLTAQLATERNRHDREIRELRSELAARADELAELRDRLDQALRQPTLRAEGTDGAPRPARKRGPALSEKRGK
jgi:DNA repair exonuclease SbcCD ATPase subunit